MVRHTHECRQRGYPFIADPSQQLAFGDGDLIRELIDGAAYLFSNEYESHMIESKTGWSAEEMLERVGTQVTTLGKDGVRIAAARRRTRSCCRRPGTSPPSSRPASATRSGPASSAPSTWGVGHERAAQVGCVLAAYVVETVGTQEYSFAPHEFLARARGVLRRRGRRRRRAAPASPVTAGVVPREPRRPAAPRSAACRRRRCPPDVLLRLHPAPRRHVDPRRGSSATTAIVPPDRDVGQAPAELDDGQRAAQAAAVQLEVASRSIGHRPTSARIPATTPGSTARNRVDLPRRRRGSARAARCRG